VKGELCTPKPPPAKQPEKFPSRYNMSSTLGFNIPAMTKRNIYTEEKKHIYKRKGKQTFKRPHSHLLI